MYQRILAAVDGSEASAAALRAAITLAKEQQGLLRLVHVVDETAGYAIDSPSVEIERLDDAGRLEGQKALDASASEARATGIEPETTLLQRDRSENAEAILAEAERWRADLIVIGTHGRHGVKRLLLGSVAEGVTRRSPVPVLLVRGT